MTEIWRAFTESPLTKLWLMDNDFQPVVGRRFTFRMAPMPSQRLSCRWNSSGDEAATGLKTVVAWTLMPLSHGTRIRDEAWLGRLDAHQEREVGIGPVLRMWRPLECLAFLLPPGSLMGRQRVGGHLPPPVMRMALGAGFCSVYGASPSNR